MDDEYYENDNRRSSRLGCRALGCGFMLVLFACVAMLAITIIAKPGIVWVPLANFANADVVVPSSIPDVEEAKAEIEKQIIEAFVSGEPVAQTDESSNTSARSVEIEVSEPIATSFARQSFDDLSNPFVEFEENEIILRWELQSAAESIPLLAEIRISATENGIAISKIGTPRLALPSALNRSLGTVLMALVGLNIQEGTESPLLYNLVGASGRVEITDFRLEENLLFLTINTSIYD